MSGFTLAMRPDDWACVTPVVHPRERGRQGVLDYLAFFLLLLFIASPTLLMVWVEWEEHRDRKDAARRKEGDNAAR